MYKEWDSVKLTGHYTPALDIAWICSRCSVNTCSMLSHWNQIHATDVVVNLGCISSKAKALCPTGWYSKE